VIFVTLSSFGEYDRRPLEILQGSGVPFKIHGTGKRITTAELVAGGQGATVVVAGVEPYDRATLAALPRLRAISRCGVGVDAIDLAAARERGVAVMNTPEAPTAAVAELALTMMLSLSRNLPRQGRAAQARKWSRIEAHLLGGRRVGIIGLGRIGRRVATLVRAFGSEVWAADPVADAAWCAEHAVRVVSLDEVLAGCDVVSIHAARSAGAPLTIGAAELGRMREGAILINLGRGDMVDVEALYAALSTGRLFGAGLDVYPEEPYAGALCDLDNVVLTPHAATLTVETRAQMEAECVRKALAFAAGSLAPEERML
jgi:D-3-phosphoglycerate dehydrogenase / 2-oxoglutarate reductase